MSSQNSDRSNDKPTKDPLVLNAFQTACLAIVVYLAIFVGDLLYKFVVEKSISCGLFFVLTIVSLFDFLEIVNNWVSMLEYFDGYRTPLFFVDVLILGTFFWQIYLLSKLINDEEMICTKLNHKALLIVVFSYGCIFILYVLWNCGILKWKSFQSSKDKKRKVIIPMCIRIFQVLVSFGILRFGVDRVPPLILFVLIGACCGYTFFHNRDLGTYKWLMQKGPLQLSDEDKSE